MCIRDRARKGKRGRAPAASFEQNVGEHLLALQAELAERRYQPGGYASFYVHEPKRRLISAAPFRDRVLDAVVAIAKRAGYMFRPRPWPPRGMNRVAA